MTLDRGTTSGKHDAMKNDNEIAIDRSLKQTREKARIVEIDQGSAGQRIDNFLIKVLKGVPRTRIYKALRKGEVRVNGSRKKATYHLCLGDQVRVPPIRHAQGKSATNIPPRLLDHVPVLFEDEHLLIVNKPSGLAVHGGSNMAYGLIEAYRSLRPDIKWLELVHRLDRETSGCLMLAKSRDCLLRLHEKLGADRSIHKHYLALVRGKVKGPKKTIQLSLRKTQGANGQSRMQVDSQGQKALSIIHPEQYFSHPKRGSHTLVNVEIKTGRMHQVRVHCASSGFPIAGDRLYGDDDYNLRLKKIGLGRLFLHARFIEMAHPMDDTSLHVQAPLPEAMQTILDQLSG